MKKHPFISRKELRVALVERCGVSAPYASQLANGRRTPGFGLAIRIERELGLPASYWPPAFASEGAA